MATSTLTLCVVFPNEEQHRMLAYLIDDWFTKFHHKAKIIYRPLKPFHVHNHKEIEIQASKKALKEFETWFSSTPNPEDAFSKHIVPNPHKQTKVEIRSKNNEVGYFAPEDEPQSIPLDGWSTKIAAAKL